MMAGIVSKTEVLFLFRQMSVQTQYNSMRGGRITSRSGRSGAGKWRSDYYLVLYIDGVKTKVKVPVRGKDGLKERVVKMNMDKYFYQSDTERVGR